MRPRDTSIRGEPMEGQASRTAEGLSKEWMGQGLGLGRLGFLPSSMVRAWWVKASKEIPRLMGSPRVATVASSASLCLGVPRCPYPSPQGRVWPKHKISVHPWPSVPILRSCHAVPQLVGSHQHVLASTGKSSPSSISAVNCLCHRAVGQDDLPQGKREPLTCP